VKITISQLAESRRLASFTVGLDVTTKLVHRIPPPPAVGPTARCSLAWGSWYPRSQMRDLGHPVPEDNHDFQPLIYMRTVHSFARYWNQDCVGWGGSMKLTKFVILGLLAFLVPLSGNAKGTYVSRSTHSSHSSSTHNSHSTRTNSAHSSRPNYGGGKHTESHGGQYPGSTNSNHKNGHYRSPVTGQDQYGKHKP
jgi:hypothetical protein